MSSNGGEISISNMWRNGVSMAKINNRQHRQYRGINKPIMKYRQQHGKAWRKNRRQYQSKSIEESERNMA
jgi:hypothetical protein